MSASIRYLNNNSWPKIFKHLNTAILIFSAILFLCPTEANIITVEGNCEKIYVSGYNFLRLPHWKFSVSLIFRLRHTVYILNCTVYGYCKGILWLIVLYAFVWYKEPTLRMNSTDSTDRLSKCQDIRTDHMFICQYIPPSILLSRISSPIHLSNSD